MVVQYVHSKTKVSLLVVNATGSIDMPFLEYLRSECSVWAWDFFVILWVKGTEESVESTWGWTWSLEIGGDQRNNYDLDLLQGGLCLNVKINTALSLTFLICVRCRKLRMWFPNTAVYVNHPILPQGVDVFVAVSLPSFMWWQRWKKKKPAFFFELLYLL